jgi:ParB family chromosome partitioning protein
MLGKGLESLIPQKGNDGSSSDPSSRPPASEPVGSPVPNSVLQPTPAISPAASRPQEEATVQQAIKEVSMEEFAAEPTLPEQIKAEPPAETKKFQQTQRLERSTQDGPRVSESVFHIEVEKIAPNPDQPRKMFDEAALRDLAHSIREFGFLQPLVVTKFEKETPNGIDVEYQLIAGERRLLAAKMLGLQSVPAIIRNVNLEREKLELAVIENIQREGLNPVETARAFQRLQEEFRMTQREIAAKLGKSRETVANTVRLLDLPEYVQQAVTKGELSESSARMLLAIQDPAAQKHLFDDIIQNKLTTRDIKQRVEQLGGAQSGPRRGRPPKGDEKPLPPEVKAMQDSLSADLGAPVEIRKNAANGHITITFYSEEELENILRRLGQAG